MSEQRSDQPVSIQQALLLAIQHQNSGRFREAEQIYRQVLAMQPANVDALNFLGKLAMQVGQPGVAIDLINRALTIAPDFAEAHRNLGNALATAGLYEEAIAAHQRAIGLRADLPHVYEHLGAALNSAGRWQEGITACRRALELNPTSSSAWHNLGNALYNTNQFAQAVDAFSQATALNPSSPLTLNNFGNALREIDQLDSAVDAYIKTLTLDPNSIDAQVNLADTRKELGQFDLAIEGFRRAIALRPDSAPAHYSLGTLLLLRGDFTEGWRELEWRWKCMEVPYSTEFLVRPRWDGADLAGRRILIHAEQGFGDMIQFARYIPLVAQRGGQVILACPDEMIDLFRGLKGVHELVSRVDPALAFEFQCPMLSLPLAFGTTLQTIPSAVPYLHADLQLTARWSEKIPKIETLKIGLAWSGRVKHRKERVRSLPAQAFAPLAQVPAIDFFSLQKDVIGQTDVISSMNLIDMTSELHSFADTAALIANLDLVISTDTAVAHLAGAMGKPTWLLLPFAADWRWMLERYDSPWYPTMKLFRQPRLGDWESVIDRVAKELIKFRSNNGDMQSRPSNFV